MWIFFFRKHWKSTPAHLPRPHPETETPPSISIVLLPFAPPFLCPSPWPKRLLFQFSYYPRLCFLCRSPSSKPLLSRQLLFPFLFPLTLAETPPSISIFLPSTVAPHPRRNASFHFYDTLFPFLCPLTLAETPPSISYDNFTKRFRRRVDLPARIGAARRGAAPPITILRVRRPPPVG